MRCHTEILLAMILINNYSSQRFQFEFKCPDLTINYSEWAISLQVGIRGWGETFGTVPEKKEYLCFIEAFLSYSLNFL
jgi:hypothetical protein